VNPNRRTFWKRYQPASLRDALVGCKDFALERHNLSVERIAERMGIPDHWALYKWIANGRMPLVHVPAYEHACGINLVTRWLAARDGRMLVDMPVGRKVTQEELMTLNAGFNAALQLLAGFYAAPTKDTGPVLSALRDHLATVASHHANVASYATPEFDFSPAEV